MEKKIRVLMAKAGLDGHDRGALVVAMALKEAGMEVIYTGLHADAEEIVAIAIQEGVDVIGISAHVGSHIFTSRKIMELQRQQGINIPVVMGGIIPEEDEPVLKEIGIAAIYGAGCSLPTVVEGVKQVCAK